MVTSAASAAAMIFVVTHRPTWLDDSAHPCLDQHLQPVRKREERIGRGD